MKINTLIKAHDDDSPAAKLDNELDSLMDKYDSQEKKPKQPEKLETKKVKGDSVSVS